MFGDLQRHLRTDVNHLRQVKRSSIRAGKGFQVAAKGTSLWLGLLKQMVAGGWKA